jgi:hypothetical protein
VIDREQGGKALSMQAKLSSKDDAYAAVVLPLSRGSVAPVDLRGSRGVRVDVRGDAALTLEVRGLDGRRWVAPVAASGGWQTLEIPFTALQGQPPYRAKGPLPVWRGNDVQQLVLSGTGQAGAKIWFEIDNVRFY